MKESHVEGPASHGDPESCTRPCEGSGEALTGAHTGGVLSREMLLIQGADALSVSGRQHLHARYGKCMKAPAWSKTSSMCGTSIRENRETSCPPPGQSEGRVGKAVGQKPAMHGHEESDRPMRYQVTRLWFRTLRRRSQKSSLTWERMTTLADTWLPKARILHPWPEQRFAAKIRDKSPVR